MGTNTPFAPFEFRDGEGNLVGFTIDLVEEIGTRAGKTIIWVDYADWDALLEAGRTGAVNMIASSMTITAARETVYDFSTPYHSANQAVLGHTSSTLTCPDKTCTATELSGLTWVVQTGTTSHDWVRDNLGEDCATGGPLFCFGDVASVINTVKTGGADVAIMDLPAAVAFANEPSNELVAIGKITTNDRYGMAVQEGDPLGILPLINPIIQQLIDEGFITQLEQVWGVPSDVSPLTAALRVGTILPVTGALAIFGPTIRLAVNLAQDEINAAGGVLGQDITVIHEDSETAAAAGVAAATKLINVDGVQAIIGALASSVSMPINEGVTTPSRVVQISPASTSPAFTDFNEGLALEDRFFFRTAPSDALQGAAAALYAFNTKGWRDMAILARADPYGSGLAQVFQDTFVALGGTITVRVDYDIMATVFDTELSLIFNSNPEAIWWVAFPGEGELIMTQWWANPAWRGPAWLWSEGTKAQTFVDDLITAGIGVKGMEGTAPITALGVADNFVIFQDAFAAANPGVDLVLFEAHSYDALYLVALAAVAREAVDSVSIRDSLIAVSSPPGTVIGPGPQEFARAVGILEAGGNINYEGASGFVNFDEFGDVGSDYEIWNISAAGQIQQVVRIPEEAVRPAPETTAPTASFTATPPSGDTTTPFAVDASASSDAEDPVTALEVQWDWEGDGVWDTTWTGQKTAEHQYASLGTYTIRMRVRDTGTLMDSTTRQVEVALDTTDPTIAIASPSEGATLTTTSVTVTGTASDNEAVEKVELSLDGTTYVLATGTTSWSGPLTLAEGPNTIFARATDTSGNAATVSIAVTVDAVSPIVSITSPADGSDLASPSVTVFGTASDDVGVAKVELSTDAANWVLTTGTTSWFFILNLTEGDHIIFARATDTFGNTATVSIAVTVDTVKPTADAGEDRTAGVGEAVSFDASGSSDNVAIVSYEWDFGDGTTGTGETTTHTYADPGTYTVTLTVRDAAGNTDTDSLTVTVEAEPFQISPSVVTFAVIGVVAAAAGVAALLILRSRGKRKGEG